MEDNMNKNKTYILTNQDNVVINISKSLERENSNYLLDNGIIISEFLAKNIYEVEEEISEEIIPIKYCYTEEDGFSINPRYTTFYTTEERIAALEDMVNMLLLGE